MQHVCICYSGDYALARATARPGDLFIYDANSGPIPDAPDVIPTYFLRPGNIFGKACFQGLWTTYLEVMSRLGCDALLSRPADTFIAKPEIYAHPRGVHLVGVRRDTRPTWRQWGCGQALTRHGVQLALHRLARVRLTDCGEPGREQEDLALSFLLRDVSLSYATWRGCFRMRGEGVTKDTSFINFDNFDTRMRDRDERMADAIYDALDTTDALREKDV